MSGARADISQGSSEEVILKSTSLPSKSAKGASFLILLQIGCRALTFIVNQVLLRFLSPRTLGLSAQLELFNVSTLYFARESLRVALQRQPSDSDQTKLAVSNGEGEKKQSSDVALSYGSKRRLQEVVNLSHAAIAIGLPLTMTIAWLYLRSADDAILETPHLRTSLYIYALATLFELLNEPAFVVAQQQMMYGTRASAEFLASFTKCLMACSIAILASMAGHNLGILPFATGQLTYAFVLNAIYLSKVYPICAQNTVSLLATAITPSDNYLLSRFSRPLISLAATLYGQSIFNQLLTSGDSYLIAAFASLPSQGAYALASNYGGLLARILFQPIEESSRSLFGRLLPPRTQQYEKNTVSDKSTNATNIAQAKSHLLTILRLYLLLALLATTLGPPLSPLLLHLVAGSRWSKTEAPAVLAAYCYYIPLLAVNGLLESFVSAVATSNQIVTQSKWKAAFSLAFALTGYLVLRVARMGAKGLVLCNAITTVLRVGWSWAFVAGYFESVAGAEGLSGEKRVGVGRGMGLGELLPSWGSLTIGIAARGVLVGLGTGRVGERGWMYVGECAGVAGGCVLGV